MNEGMNQEWKYFVDEKFHGIVMSLRPGDQYFYRAPNGDKFEVRYLARKGSRIRVGIRPVDENNEPIIKPKGGKNEEGNFKRD